MGDKYWRKNGVDAHWNTVTGNWWNDVGHTSQASSIPVTGDFVYILGGATPDTAPAAVALSRFDTQAMTQAFSGKTTNLSIQSGGTLVMGDPTGTLHVAQNWQGVTALSGTFVFYDVSANGNTVGDYATFHHNSNLDWAVAGDYATFYDNSGLVARSEIGDYATFYDTSSAASENTVGDYATFYDSSSAVNGGTVGDYATFYDSSFAASITLGDYLRVESNIAFTGVTIGLTAENSGNIIGG